MKSNLFLKNLLLLKSVNSGHKKSTVTRFTFANLKAL